MDFLDFFSFYWFSDGRFFDIPTPLTLFYDTLISIHARNDFSNESDKTFIQSLDFFFSFAFKLVPWTLRATLGRTR